MLLIPDCSDRTARKIDKHVLSVPLTLMMGRRYFLCICSQEVKTKAAEQTLGLATPRPLVRIQPYALSNVFLLI